MEVEEIVIVGAGIGGAATALGLHRIGLRSLVLESADSLRISGFALTLWSNAWKALDTLGIGDPLREQHTKLSRLTLTPIVTKATAAEVPLTSFGESHDLEVRCVRRQALVETIVKELPDGTIRFGSKVVSINQDEKSYLIHLADGTLVRAKVLIGCDGVNSVVAKWLGLPRPVFAGRSAIRGLAHYPGGHGYEPRFAQFFGNGIRFGLLPCDEKTVYWFCTIFSGSQAPMKDDALKLRELVMSGVKDVPQAVSAIEHTELNSILCSPLTHRSPWTMLRGQIGKGKVCMAGDAMHPMLPDIGQGGCCTLEDAVVMVRCLGEAFLGCKGSDEHKDQKIEKGLEKYVKQRRERWLNLTVTSYWVGAVKQSGDMVVSFVRDRFLLGLLAWVLVERTMFDCGKLQGY